MYAIPICLVHVKKSRNLFFFTFQNYFSRICLKLPRNNKTGKDVESIEREDQSRRENSDETYDQDADRERAAEFRIHDTSLLLKRKDTDNKMINVDLHKSVDGHIVKFRQSKKYPDTHSERSNGHHYEKLNRDGKRSDKHYAELVKDGNLPPNMQASVAGKCLHLIS